MSVILKYISAISSTCTFSVNPGLYTTSNWRKITSDLEERGRRIFNRFINRASLMEMNFRRCLMSFTWVEAYDEFSGNHFSCMQSKQLLAGLSVAN